MAHGNGGGLSLQRKGVGLREVFEVGLGPEFCAATFVEPAGASRPYRENEATDAGDGDATGGGVWRRSGIAELAVEVPAHPAEEENGCGYEGDGHGRSEDFGFPTVVEQMVGQDEDHRQQADEAHQNGDRHDDMAKGRAFALAGESLGSVGESGHCCNQSSGKMAPNEALVKPQSDARK